MDIAQPIGKQSDYRQQLGLKSEFWQLIQKVANQ
jgi:hypothetical protein